MEWIDIAMILFSCVAANHLGLIAKIEEITGFEIPIVNCVKCFSYWVTFLYCLTYTSNVITVIAISFLNAYLALWVELGMGYIDYLYDNVYDKIYTTAEDEQASAEADDGNTASTLS